jgi:hypothetical protein
MFSIDDSCISNYNLYLLATKTSKSQGWRRRLQKVKLKTPSPGGCTSIIRVYIIKWSGAALHQTARPQDFSDMDADSLERWHLIHRSQLGRGPAREWIEWIFIWCGRRNARCIRESGGRFAPIRVEQPPLSLSMPSPPPPLPAFLAAFVHIYVYVYAIISPPLVLVAHSGDVAHLWAHVLPMRTMVWGACFDVQMINWVRLSKNVADFTFCEEGFGYELRVAVRSLTFSSYAQIEFIILSTKQNIRLWFLLLMLDVFKADPN